MTFIKRLPDHTDIKAKYTLYFTFFEALNNTILTEIQSFTLTVNGKGML